MPFSMDIKKTVDALAVIEISEKLQGLGEKVRALSERPIVSMLMSRRSAADQSL